MKKTLFKALVTIVTLLTLMPVSVDAKVYLNMEEMFEDIVIDMVVFENKVKNKTFKFDEDDYELITYEDIMRKRGGLEDVRHTFFAEVQQYEEAGDFAYGLLMRDGDLDRTYFAIFPVLPDDRIMEDDKLDIYGELKGLVTYDTVIGGSKTVPVILVEKVLIEGIDY